MIYVRSTHVITIDSVLRNVGFHVWFPSWLQTPTKFSLHHYFWQCRTQGPTANRPSSRTPPRCHFISTSLLLLLLAGLSNVTQTDSKISKLDPCLDLAWSILRKGSLKWKSMTVASVVFICRMSENALLLIAYLEKTVALCLITSNKCLTQFDK